jgi:CheY-like chemotaxis protein
VSATAAVSDEPGVILVVDDNTAGRYIASSWLRRHGYEVIEAGTGAEALATLARESVDLVVLDVGLPDMSGFDVCEKIKDDPTRALPVIHMSATAIRGVDRAQGLTRGADAYLVEPVEPDELVATVGAVLRYYRARTAAERLAGRLTGLTAATLAMYAATTFDQLAVAIAEGAAGIVEGAAVAILTAPDGGLRRASVDPSTGAPAVFGSAPTAMMGDLAARAHGVRRGATFEVPWQLVAPDAAGGPALAALFGSRSGSPLAIVVDVAKLDEETDLLAQLGHAAVLASDSLRLHTEEHTLALTLQRSFLPTLPTDRPGMEIAVRYVPAARNAEIGGDFYEVVELEGGRLLIAIGDVAGHSIHAATIMVELRHALRAYAVEGHRPTEILERLETMLKQYHPREFATLCLMLLDPDRNELTMANAGHLPPLLIEPAATGTDRARYLEVDGPMLGLRRTRPADTVLRLPAHWSVVLITDGLVEHPGGDLDVALEELRSFSMVDMAAEQLCEKLLERFGRAGLDDIALLVLRQQATDVATRDQ